MTSPALSPRSRFGALVRLPDREVPLAEAALWIAAEEYPQLTPLAYLRRLDLLAERVRDRLNEETAPLLVLQEMNAVLYEQEGFRGNVEAYYDPRNSYLNDVLDRRLGIPITLSIVYLEVGWRLGLPLTGVQFPGHFLVRFEGEAMRVTVDPFQRGRLRFDDDLQPLLDRLYGGMVRMRDDFLREASRKAMLVRLLMNLKSVHVNTRDDVRALAAVDRILMIRPGAADEIRDRGMLLARSGRVDEAIAELEQYLESAADAGDRTRVRMLIDQLREDGP